MMLCRDPSCSHVEKGIKKCAHYDEMSSVRWNGRLHPSPHVQKQAEELDELNRAVLVTT